jgi:DNA-binding transcriptional ArsR family regulator
VFKKPVSFSDAQWKASPIMYQTTHTEDPGETLFLRTLGIKSPVFRILDFLMDNKAYDYSKTDIAKGAGISRTTLSSAWENLEKNGLVSETREVGRAKMYKLNLKSPVVLKFIELDNAICELYRNRLEDQEDSKDLQDNRVDLRPILA